MRHTKIYFSQNDEHLDLLRRALHLENLHKVYELSQTLEQALSFLSPPYHTNTDIQGRTVVIRDFPLTGKTCLAYNLAMLWMQANWARYKGKPCVSILHPENVLDLTVEMLEQEIASLGLNESGTIQNLLLIDDFDEIIHQVLSPELFVSWATRPVRNIHKVILVSEGSVQESKFQLVWKNDAQKSDTWTARTNLNTTDVEKLVSGISFENTQVYDLSGALRSQAQEAAQQIMVRNEDQSVSYLIGLIDKNIKIDAEKLRRTGLFKDLQSHNDALALLQSYRVVCTSSYFNRFEAISDEILRDVYCRSYNTKWSEFEAAAEKLVSAGLFIRQNGLISVSEVWVRFADTLTSQRSYSAINIEQYIQQEGIRFGRTFSYHQLAEAQATAHEYTQALVTLSNCSEHDLRFQTIGHILKDLLPAQGTATLQAIRESAYRLLLETFKVYAWLHTRSDPYVKYKLALDIAREYIQKPNENFDSQRHRLLVNIERSRNFGETDNNIAERNETIHNINQVLAGTGLSFSDIYETSAQIRPDILYDIVRNSSTSIGGIQIITEMLELAITEYCTILATSDIILGELREEWNTLVAIHSKLEHEFDLLALKRAFRNYAISQNGQFAIEDWRGTSFQVRSTDISLSDLAIHLGSGPVFQVEEIKGILGVLKLQHGLPGQEHFISLASLFQDPLWADLEKAISILWKNEDPLLAKLWLETIIDWFDQLIVPLEKAQSARAAALALLLAAPGRGASDQGLLSSLYNKYGALLYCQAISIALSKSLCDAGSQVSPSSWLSIFQNDPSLIDSELKIFLDSYLVFGDQIRKDANRRSLDEQVGQIHLLQERYPETFFLLDRLYPWEYRKSSASALLAKWSDEAQPSRGWELLYVSTVAYYAFELYQRNLTAQAQTVFNTVSALVADFELDFAQEFLNETSALISTPYSAKNGQPLYQVPTEFPIQDPYLKPILNEILFGRYNQAMESINIYISGNEYNHEAWYLLGICHTRSYNDLNAIHSFNNCIGLQSKYIPAYIQIAAIYHKLEKTDLEIATLKRARAIDIMDFGVNFNLGLAYQYKKQYKKAVEHFLYAQKALSNQDHEKQNIIRRNLANGYRFLKKYGKALSVYLDGFRAKRYNSDLLPTFLDIVMDLSQKKGFAYENIKLDPQEFIQVLLDYMLKQGVAYEDLFAISATYFHFNDVRNGWKIYDHIFDYLAQRSRSVNPLDLIIDLLLRSGQTKLAQYYIGIRNVRKNNFEEAILNFEEYANDFPMHSEAIYQLGKAHLELARSQLALRLTDGIDVHIDAALQNAIRARSTGVPRERCNALVGEIYLLGAKDRRMHDLQLALSLFNEVLNEVRGTKTLARILEIKFRLWSERIHTRELQPSDLLASFNLEIMSFIDGHITAGRTPDSAEFGNLVCLVLLEFYERLKNAVRPASMQDIKTCAQFMVKAGKIIETMFTGTDYKLHVQLGKLYWEKHLLIDEDAGHNQAKIEHINKAIQEWQLAQDLIHRTVLSRIERTAREELEIMIGSARKKLKLLAVPA